MPSDKDRSSGFPTSMEVGSIPSPPADTTAGGEAAHPFATDDRLRYGQARVLGEGGMGVVEEVHDRRLGRQVARKRCHASGTVGAARFAREAWITAHLDHPGIVPVHDAGIGPDGQLHYIMRLVRGVTLRDALNEPAGATPWLRGELDLLRHLRDVAEAVGFAHRHGIVHRDLKPSNVMVGPFGETQVMDWGLARPVPGPAGDGWRQHLSDEIDVQTVEGAVLGTPQYMSPEQALGQPLGPPADVWSLGVMLFEVVSGDKPFPGGSLGEVVAQITAGRPVLERLDSTTVPPPLRTIIARALSAQPDERYADAKALADDLNRWLAGHRVEAHTYGTAELVGGFIHRFRLPLAVGTAVLAVAIGGLVWLILQANTEAERANQAEADARQVQARLLVQQALDAHEQRDRARAEVLAAAALVRAEDPDARGVLAAHALDPRPVLVVDEPGRACDSIAVSDRSQYFTCLHGSELDLWSTRPLARMWTLPTPPATVTTVDDQGFVLALQSRDAMLGSRVLDVSGAIVQRLIAAHGQGVLPPGGTGEVYTLNRSLSRVPLSGQITQVHPCAQSGARTEAGVMLACAGQIVEWTPEGTQSRSTEVGSTDLGFANRMVVGAGYVVLGTEVGWVVAHAWPQGDEIWRANVGHAVAHLALSQDGERVAVQPAKGGPIVLAAETGVEQFRLRGEGGQSRLAFDDQGLLWTIGKRIVAWQLEPPPVADLGFGITGIAFADDGTALVATHSSGFAHLTWPSLEPVLTKEYGSVVAKDVVAVPGGGFRIALNRLDEQGLLDEAGRPLAVVGSRPARRMTRFGDHDLLTAGIVQGLVRRLPMDGGVIGDRMSTAPGVYDLDGTPDGAFVVFVDTEGVGLLRHPSPVPDRVIADHAVRAADISGDGTLVVATGQNTVWAVNSATHEEIWRYESDPLLPRQLRISPDGRWVAVGDDIGQVHVLELRTGRVVARLQGHREQVPALAFAPDGQRLVSGSWDDHLSIWDLSILDEAPEALQQRVEAAWNLTEADLLRGH